MSGAKAAVTVMKRRRNHCCRGGGEREKFAKDAGSHGWVQQFFCYLFLFSRKM